jgi:cytidine deaminase
MTSDPLQHRHDESAALPQEDKDLLSTAKEAAANAYARYSSFKVGAALRTNTGTVYSGCNVENVSYPIGICAERNAIAAAVLGEGPEMKIAAIAVAAQGKNRQWTGVIPCGACRQAIFEFGPDARVVFTDANGSDRVETIGNLLPEAFSF